MTVDYNGEQAAPEPASAVIGKFLRRSISVADIFKRAARGWLFGLVGMGLGLLFGVYTIWVTPPTYSVTIGLLPTDSSGGDIALGGDTSGPLGAIAGMLGMGGGQVPKFTRFVASLYTTSVAKIMDRDYDMICRTYSGDCDIETHTWRKHTGFDSWVRNLVAAVAHMPDPDSPKTVSDLASYTENNVVITSDKTTHVLTLTMDSRDPKFATMFLQNLVNSANHYIRQEDRNQIQPYVAYINAKLATTTLNVIQHDALSSLLLEQERKLMLSSVNVAYAASIQDGPNISSSNAAIRLLLVDALLGIVLGVGAGMFVSGRLARRRARSQAWQR